MNINKLFFLQTVTELYDQMYVVYGFQVLKKFGDVVWQC